MQYYYSSSTLGFYVDAIHGKKIPSDAVSITQAEHIALLKAEAQGKIIQPDENGYPVAVVPEPLAPTEQELAEQRIVEIEQELTANGLASLHPLRAKVAGTATSEDEVKLAELDEQAKALQAELVTLSAPKDMR